MVPNHNADVQSVTPVVSVIVPARNEEASLAACLRSLVEQQGIHFELLVVDDGSTDSTPEIIRRFVEVSECPFVGTNPFLLQVLAMDSRVPHPRGWTGKANALWTAAQVARGEWLLFTDADTIHEPGSLARALQEAEEHHAVMLSYSPRQIVETIPERILMPVIFAELASRFKPEQVRDQKSQVAAANGQYMLIRRKVYDAIGGHAAVAKNLLEDVALARLVKRSAGHIRFRFGGDQVSTRMYRSWHQLVEGWTKNLVLLFPDAVSKALVRALEFVALWVPFVLGAVLMTRNHHSTGLVLVEVGLLAWIVYGLRIRKAHAGIFNSVIAFLGLPFFSWLLLNSVRAHREGAVTWKGRTYAGSESTTPNMTSEDVTAADTKMAHGKSAGRHGS